MACPKGWEALTVLDAADRATTPLLRDRRRRPPADRLAHRDDDDGGRFKAIQAEHGADSVAFLSTGQIATEEMALLGAVAKFGMGMVHGDGNTRQCMATAVVAYKQAFGFDAPPYTYQDFEESDCIVLVGSNLCIAHPDPVGARDAKSASAGDHRHRPAPDRDRDGRDAALASPAQDRPGALLWPRAIC